MRSRANFLTFSTNSIVRGWQGCLKIENYQMEESIGKRRSSCLITCFLKWLSPQSLQRRQLKKCQNVTLSKDRSACDNSESSTRFLIRHFDLGPNSVILERVSDLLIYFKKVLLNTVSGTSWYLSLQRFTTDSYIFNSSIQISISLLIIQEISLII